MLCMQETDQDHSLYAPNVFLSNMTSIRFLTSTHIPSCSYTIISLSSLNICITELFGVVKALWIISFPPWTWYDSMQLCRCVCSVFRWIFIDHSHESPFSDLAPQDFGILWVLIKSMHNFLRKYN